MPPTPPAQDSAATPSDERPFDIRNTDVERLLDEVGRQGADASTEIYALLYERLRLMARSYLSSRRDRHTLQPTALVHEAYLKIAGSKGEGWQSRSHFLALAATAMRQVLVDYARASSAAKRGGDWARVTLRSGVMFQDDRAVDLLSLDEALKQLHDIEPRKARVVELRFFAGLSVEESADALGVSRRTLLDDWRVARAWLAAALSDEPRKPS